MPSLIVNADDFGRAVGVNRGILEAHARGIVTSTTAMVNYPDAPVGLEMALETAPDLGLGVHLTLTSGRPVSPPERVPTLVDEDGRFYAQGAFYRHFRDIDADDLRRELTAQVERFIALTGRPPTHLDSHHHAAYIHPDALCALLALALQYNIPVRRPYPGDSPPADLRSHLPMFPPEQARALADQLAAILADGPRPPWPDRLEMRFFGENAILGELLVILTNLPAEGVTELMCHPRYLDGLDADSYRGEGELDTLTHSGAHEVVAAENIRLMTFAELPR